MLDMAKLPASLFALKPGEHAIETLGDDEDQTIL